MIIGMAGTRQVTAVLACHNRRDLTLRCLDSLFEQSEAGVSVSAVLVDDGSNDGTGAAVMRRFSRVRVVRGTGNMFWARAMAMAESHAVRARPDFLLWLNDDVTLAPGALGCLLHAAASTSGGALVCGAVLDPEVGTVTYSGVRRSGLHPLKFDRVTPTGSLEPVDTFNGNVVLVSRAAYERVGGIDPGFVHSYADFDYGLRARAAGIQPYLAAEWVGTCRRDPRPHPWRHGNAVLLERYRMFTSHKGGTPLRSHARYLRRHGGLLWPVFWAAPYVRFACLSVVDHPFSRWPRRLRKAPISRSQH